MFAATTGSARSMSREKWMWLEHPLILLSPEDRRIYKGFLAPAQLEWPSGSASLEEELPTIVKCTPLHFSDSDFKARCSEMLL